MKTFLFLTAFFISTNYFTQTKNTESSNPITEKAEFPGGQTAFRKEFMKMVYAYVDVTAYAVNGKFTFVIAIDEKGKMSSLKSYPRVKNDEEFVQDMTFAMKRIKKKWKPASKNGVPIESSYIFEINFTTDHSDEEY